VADRSCIGDTGALYCDNISAEDVFSKQKYISTLFLDILRLCMFFVGLAVTSKPSSQPIWLKVYTH